MKMLIKSKESMSSVDLIGFSMMTESWKSKPQTYEPWNSYPGAMNTKLWGRDKKSADIAACCHYFSSVSLWALTTDDTTPFIADKTLTQDKHFNFQGKLNQLG